MKALRSLAQDIFAASAFLGACSPAPLRLAAESPREGVKQVLYSSDSVQLDDVRDFYYRVFGRDEYSIKWSDLEALSSGSAIPERKPYLDSWYPQSKGGTNMAGALQRYDQAFYNGEAKAALWEASHHGGSVSWAGHCDGNSASTIRFQNPRLAVNRPKACDPNDKGKPCTVFSPGDIRALLTEMNMNAKAKFIAGERCEKTFTELGQEPYPRSEPTRMDSCNDANPASFHAGIVNFLGRMKQPLVFDFAAYNEVWNYPIYSYSYTTSGPLTPAQAMSEMGLGGKSWIFNPGAASLIKVSMTLNYRESRSDLNGSGTIPPELSSKTYSYILELDQSQRLVGGEWQGSSRNDHPDFIWMPFEPTVASGDTRAGNPHLSNNEVIRLWAESIGLDPETPFRDKPENLYDIRFWPISQDIVAWGQVVGYYRLILDGRTNGGVFMGKRTQLRVEVGEALQADSKVELLLNGSKVSEASVSNGFADFIFDPSAGINILSLRWNSPRVGGAEIDRDFRIFAM